MPSMETNRARRAPWTKRLKMSMPFLSVPSRFLVEPASRNTIEIWSPTRASCPPPVMVASPILILRWASLTNISFKRLSRLTFSTTVFNLTESPTQAGGNSLSVMSPRRGS